MPHQKATDPLVNLSKSSLVFEYEILCRTLDNTLAILDTFKNKRRHKEKKRKKAGLLEWPKSKPAVKQSITSTITATQ